MINSYLNSFKISKKPIKQQGLCTKAKLGKKSKIISSVLIKNEYFLEFKRQCSLKFIRLLRVVFSSQLRE